MDEDLKIVLKAELEADEAASAQRIASQLPNIAKLINAKSTIKVGVSLDSANINSEAQKISQKITQAVKTQQVGVTLHLNRQSVEKIQGEMANLGVDGNISNAMTKQLDTLGVQIDKIKGSWQAVASEEGNAAQNQEQLLNLSIQGTDQMGRMVSYMGSYNTESGKLEVTLTNVTANLKQQRTEQEQLVKYTQNQLDALEKMRNAGLGITSGNGVKDKSSVQSINDEYNKIYSSLESLRNGETEFSAQTRANIDSMLRQFSELIKSYQTVEQQEKQLAAETERRNSYLNDQLAIVQKIQNSYSGVTARGLTDDTHLSEMKQKYQEIINLIDQYRSRQGTLNSAEKSQLESLITGLSEAEKGYRRVEAAADSNQAMLDKWAAKVDDIGSKYANIRITGDQAYQLYEAYGKYQNAVSALNAAFENNGDKFSNTQIEGIKKIIDEYEKLANSVVATNKAQAVAEESRETAAIRLTTQLDSIKARYEGLTSVTGKVSDESNLSILQEKYESIVVEINKLESASGKLSTTETARIKSMIDGLSRLAVGYSNAERAATKLQAKPIEVIKSEQQGILEKLQEHLRSAGILTDEFKNKIAGLQSELNSVTERNGITTYMSNLSLFQNEIGTLKERLSGLDSIYQKMIANEQEIFNTRKEIASLDSGKDQNRIAELQERLALLKKESAEIQSQAAPYADILDYSSKRVEYLRQANVHASEMKELEAGIRDQAEQCDTAMKGINTTIADLEARFRKVNIPTETLKANMQAVRDLAKQYGNDQTDKEKVQTYEQLNEKIKACNTEMTQLMRVQRGDVADFKFSANLEKAKADLETIGRTWSALKSDPGLNSQFDQLSRSLSTVNNQMDLNKWAAQFSAFKSQVKAAGKNMQSFGDIMKNNIAKVFQWVSATTLLFRAFRLVKSAITTIVDLNTAMVDLRKTTDETEDSYQRFYETANDTAKAMGATTEEIISQTAAWSRLGYSMSDSAKMAELSSEFASISPGMDVDTATNGLVSVMKAFGYTADEVLDGVMSKINEVGNTAALSNLDIVEALSNSASAMAIMNGSLEETIALITAAQEITQDASKVGNAIRSAILTVCTEMCIKDIFNCR